MTNEGERTVLTCKNTDCGAEFLVIPHEQKIYQKKGIPAPDFCPACRHKQRMALRNERQMYKCGNSMLATYPEDAPYLIYCQECFWKHID